MKKNKMLLMVLSLLLVLSGCTVEVEEVEENVDEANKAFEVLIEKELNDVEYIIIREKKTDVMYLITDENSSTGGSAATTVMVEEDGSPLTYNEWLQMEEK